MRGRDILFVAFAALHVLGESPDKDSLEKQDPKDGAVFGGLIVLLFGATVVLSTLAGYCIRSCDSCMKCRPCRSTTDERRVSKFSDNTLHKRELSFESMKRLFYEDYLPPAPPAPVDPRDVYDDATPLIDEEKPVDQTFEVILEQPHKEDKQSQDLSRQESYSTSMEVIEDGSLHESDTPYDVAFADVMVKLERMRETLAFQPMVPDLSRECTV